MTLNFDASTVIKGVGSAVLHVHDLRQSAEWYSAILDVPLSPVDDDTPFFVFNMKNGVTLMLVDQRKMEIEAPHPICMFLTGDISDAISWFQESRITITAAKQAPDPASAFVNVMDPEGNVVMICQKDWKRSNPVYSSNSAHPIKTHLNHVVIPVKNLKRATGWYSRLLGQPIHPERQDGGPVYWFEMENETSVLLDDNRNNQDLDRFPTFMLKTDNIEKAYAMMRDKGVEIVRDIQFDQYFMICDNEKNSIIICK